MNRVWALILLVCGVARAATYTEGDFGFDAEAADNFAALEAMAAGLADGDTVTFTNGVYSLTIVTNATSDRYYRGGAILDGLSNVTIDAPGATFHADTWDVHFSDKHRSIFLLKSCTNVTLRLKLSGEQTGNVTQYAPIGVNVWSNCANISVSCIATGLHSSVRIGGATSIGAQVHNTNISVVSTNYDTMYGIEVRSSSDSTVTNYSVGTSGRGYALHRALYIAGATNITAHSWARDANVSDGVHLVTSQRNGESIHGGSSNVTLTATDLGTTYYPSRSRKFAKVGIVTSGVSSTPTTHSDITFNLSVVSDGSLWPSNHLFALGSVGTTPAHTFERITISGTWDRLADTGNAMAAVWLGDSTNVTAGIAGVSVLLRDFTDNSAGGGQSVLTYIPDVPITIEACNTTLGSTIILASSENHTFTDLGSCESDYDPPPVPELPGASATLRGEVAIQGQAR